MVRIRFPPAVSRQTIGSSAAEPHLPFVMNQRKRSVSGPAQAAARVASSGCQFQGRSSAMRRAGWSAMRASTSAR